METKKTVLVTGGVRRLGGAISARLARGGWRVLAHTRSAQSAAARAFAAEHGVELLEGDLSRPLGAAQLFKAAVEAAPDVSCIVNNAACYSLEKTLEAEEEAAMERLNLSAPESLTAMLGLRLLENPPGLPRRGAVVDILDAGVRAGGSGGETPYAKTKAALAESMVKAAGLFADSIRVNAVAPGAVLAPEGVHVGGGDVLLPERPAPEDVAEAVAYLLVAGGVTGQTITVDSGRFMLP